MTIKMGCSGVLTLGTAKFGAILADVEGKMPGISHRRDQGMFEQTFHGANTAPTTRLLDKPMPPTCEATVNLARHA